MQAKPLKAMQAKPLSRPIAHIRSKAHPDVANRKYSRSSSSQTAHAQTGAAAEAAASPHAALHGDLPPTFKRLIAQRVGQSFSEVAVVQEAPMPAPGPGEVLVRMQYAGINGGCETFRVRGEFAFAGNRAKPWYPLGAEGAGVVVALGEDVSSLQVGQPVACNGASAFTEYAVAKAAMCTPVAAASAEAVALVLSGVTACAALEGTAAVKAGESVLVTAAAGGTGHFAVQLAKLAGCRVAAVVGSEAKAQALRRLGDTAPDLIINYKQQDVGEALRDWCPSGLDVVYEGVGGELRRSIFRHLAPAGRLLQVGYISEYPHTQQAGQVPAAAKQEESSSGTGGGSGSGGGGDELEVSCAELFWKGRTVEVGQQRIIGSIWPKDVAVIRRCRQRVFDLYEAGKLQAWTDTSHGYTGVEGVAAAIDYMLQGGHTGKVVIPLQ